MARRTLLILLLSVFVAMLGMGIIIPILPIYATELGASGTALGIMVAGFSVTRGVLQPLVGGYSDRIGKKPFIAAGMTIYAIVGLTYATADSVLALIIIRLFHGVGSAMIVPVAMSYVGDLAPEGSEGRYMSYLNIALFVGIGSGPVIGGFFLDSFGANSAFLAMSTLAGTAVVLLALLLPADRQAHDGAHPPLFATLGRAARDRRVGGILVARLSSTLVTAPAMAFLPLLMARFMDASGTQIGVVIATRTLVNAALQTPFGRLADRVDRVRLLVVGASAMGVAIIGVALAGTFPQLLALFVLMGAGEAIVWPVLGALATEQGRVHGQGAVMGLLNMAMSAGIFIGSLGAGAIVDFVGLNSAFVAMGVFVAVGTAIAVVMLRGAPPPALAVSASGEPHERERYVESRRPA